MPDPDTPYPHLVHKRPGLCREKWDTVVLSNGDSMCEWESTKSITTVFTITLSIAVQTVLNHLSAIKEGSEFIQAYNFIFSIDLLNNLTWVPVELTLQDRFGEEPYQKTTTQNPLAESDGRAPSSHSQIPVCARSL